MNLFSNSFKGQSLDKRYISRKQILEINVLLEYASGFAKQFRINCPSYPIINKIRARILRYYEYLCRINYNSYQEIQIFAKKFLWEIRYKSLRIAVRPVHHACVE